MKLYGLIGRSLSHSFSQKYFAEKFKKEGITDCEYKNFELPNLKDYLPGLRSNPDLCGLNITIPYKTEILPFLQHVTPEVSDIGACNCVKIDHGIWTGYNTDTAGFQNSFAAHLKPFHQNALVLGTGGASKAVTFVLNKLGIPFKKVSRNPVFPFVISYDEASKSFDQFQIVINTTPLGTFPNVDECPSLPYELVTAKYYFYDLIYNPEKTRFLALAEKQGAAIENGAKMLQIQAEESWRIWNGRL